MKRRIAREVGTKLRRYPGRMTSQDYVGAFYRKYRDLPDALKAYRAEKSPSKSVSAYRNYVATELLKADADPKLFLAVTLSRLRRSFPVDTDPRSSTGMVAREIDTVLEDLVAIYRSPRTFFKDEGRWSTHFGGAILLASGSRFPARTLELIARRWGRGPFQSNRSVKNLLEEVSAKKRDVVEHILRKFDDSRGPFVEGRRTGSKDSKPRATSGRITARNREVEVEAREIMKRDPFRDRWGIKADAYRNVAARSGVKPESVKKGLARDKAHRIR